MTRRPGLKTLQQSSQTRKEEKKKRKKPHQDQGERERKVNDDNDDEREELKPQNWFFLLNFMFQLPSLSVVNHRPEAVLFLSSFNILFL